LEDIWLASIYKRWGKRDGGVKRLSTKGGEKEIEG